MPESVDRGAEKVGGRTAPSSRRTGHRRRSVTRTTPAGESPRATSARPAHLSWRIGGKLRLKRIASSDLPADECSRPAPVRNDLRVGNRRARRMDRSHGSRAPHRLRGVPSVRNSALPAAQPTGSGTYLDVARPLQTVASHMGSSTLSGVRGRRRSCRSASAPTSEPRQSPGRGPRAWRR
jgi:hypothetical protein